MKRFKIIDGCYLNSTGISLKGETYHTATTEAEEEELLRLAQMKSVSEVVMTPAPVAAPVQQPADDLAEVPGIGQSTLEKLATMNITSKSHLAAALKTKEEELKTVFGLNFPKVVKFFGA